MKKRIGFLLMIIVLVVSLFSLLGLTTASAAVSTLPEINQAYDSNYKPANVTPASDLTLNLPDPIVDPISPATVAADLELGESMTVTEYVTTPSIENEVESLLLGNGGVSTDVRWELTSIDPGLSVNLTPPVQYNVPGNSTVTFEETITVADDPALVGQTLHSTVTFYATIELITTLLGGGHVEVELGQEQITINVVAPNIVDPKTVELAVDADGDGVPGPGDTLKYTAEIDNTGSAAANGVTFSDTPDANTSLVVGSVTKTQGSVIKGNHAGDKTVEVYLGTIPAGGTATVTFEVTINDPLWEFFVANQAIVMGRNFDLVRSDDPGTPKIGDATVTKVKMSPPVHGPGLSQWGIVILVVLFGGAMTWMIRRRQVRSRIY